MVALAALLLALWPTFPLVFVAEVLHGTSGGILAPAIASISLGLAGRRGMALRVGRNFRFAAAGNALTAAAILYIPTLWALRQIRADEID